MCKVITCSSEMPTDEPMLRTSANTAAPSLRSAGSSVEKTIVESGTKISPEPSAAKGARNAALSCASGMPVEAPTIVPASLASTAIAAPEAT